MKLNKNLIISVIIAFIILVFLFVYFFYPQHKCVYEEEIDGIIFCSNTYSEPGKFLRELTEFDYFVVSPEMREGEGSNYVNSVNSLFVVILKSQDKNAVTVIRILNEKNDLNYCQTNYGSYELNEKISGSECLELLNDSRAVKIKFSLIDSSIGKPEVVLSKKELLIKANSGAEGQRTAVLLLKTMYKDTEKIVEEINNLSKKLRV